jgi:catechol 2,3-dioxygenase-like lactoylglutathione lyase family enzyme
MAVELDVSDLDRSVAFYVSVLGFTVAVDRPERRFAYLTRNASVDLMLQSADGPGHRVPTAELQRPFGRGVSVVIRCRDAEAVFAAATEAGGNVVVQLEERRYSVDVVAPTARWADVGSRVVVNRQFVVADPDGYLLRFVTDGTS